MTLSMERNETRRSRRQSRVQAMQEPASILRPDGKPLAETEVPGESPGRGPLKFAFVSGAQPLAGYTIKRGIGVGGFGEVYYAVSDSGKEVALKRIQRNLDIELRGVKQCLNLKHPNLLSLYDIRYDDQDQAWVVMEYVAGESLQDAIERNPNGLPRDQIQHWLAGIARGLAYLHDHGIVHRDLKPGNIFLDQGVVKIGDYGLSKFISCSCRSGQTESVGTFHYMAPEIGLGRYGKEIDIYALGILLYEMLTGHVPFEGESSQEIIMKHLTADPDLKPLREPFRAVVGRALAKDPERRFRSVGDMMSALRPGWNEGPADVVATLDGDRRPPVVAQIVRPGVLPGSPPNIEEPVARAVRDGIRSLQASWNRIDLNRPTQLVLFAVGVILLISGAQLLLPLGISLAMLYGIYYLVWYLVLRPRTLPVMTTHSPVPVAQVVSPTPPEAPAAREPVAPARGRRRRAFVSRQQINEALRAQLRQKSLRQQLTELTGSMLMSAFVAAVLSVVMLVLGSQHLDAHIGSWGPLYAWLTLTSTVGAWSVLCLAKLWEGTTGDQAMRRFCLLAAGFGLGAFAWFLSRFLFVEPSYLLGSWEGFRHGFGAQIPALYEVTGTPRPLAYMGYFGGLFLLLRWWLNADPLRTNRLGVLGTTFTVAWAIVLHSLLPIPRGYMVAATATIAIQLSAPWIDAAQRKRAKDMISGELSEANLA